MSWSGTLRAMQAAQRRAERDAQRQYRELQRRTKEQARLSALEQARLEVAMYENRLELVLSVHKEQCAEWDWQNVIDTPPPIEPVRQNTHATGVEQRRSAYSPSFFDKLFARTRKQLEVFEVELQFAADRDEREFQDAWTQYQRDYAEWEDERNLGVAVLAGNDAAYARVLQEFSPFSELSELGSSFSFRIHTPQLVEVLIKVKGDQAIPSEIKSLTSTGKVSTKAMPKARFHEIYQDYVCGCVLRVAREVFGLLPIETAMVTALTDLFDSRTGRTAEQPILSVVMPRAVMKKLDFYRLDTSDSMDNFLHRRDFNAARKSGAFSPITPLTLTDLEPTRAPGNSTSAAVVSTATAPPSVPPSVNPFPEKWAEALRSNEIHFGFLRLTTNELAQMLGKTPQDNFTLAESKALARAAEGFGYCLEPDPRHGAGNFWGTRELGIFQPPSGTIQQPSANFLGASAFLQICLLVAAADGTVDRRELDQFRRFIEGHYPLTIDERQRLLVLETLLARNPSPAKVTLGRTLKHIPPEKHLVIGQFLVDVAASDGVISPSEHKAISRIFETLGLSTDILETLIRNLAASGREVLIQTAEVAPAGEQIPESVAAPPKAVLKLDMARIAAITAETHEVIDLLAKAMSEDEDEGIALPAQPELNAKPAFASVTPAQDGKEDGASTLSMAPLQSLDPTLQPILQKIISRESWARSEFDALAQEYHFMPLSVFDRINEWADQQLGDFLLEGEEPVSVHRSLLKN